MSYNIIRVFKGVCFIMLELFVLLKEKPSINKEFIEEVSEKNHFILKNKSSVVLNKEVNNTYLLHFVSSVNCDAIDYLKKAGFIQGKFIFL